MSVLGTVRDRKYLDVVSPGNISIYDEHGALIPFKHLLCAQCILIS